MVFIYKYIHTGLKNIFTYQRDKYSNSRIYFTFIFCLLQGLHARNEEGAACSEQDRLAGPDPPTSAFSFMVNLYTLHSCLQSQEMLDIFYLQQMLNSIWLCLSSFRTNSRKLFHNSFEDLAHSSVKAPLYSATSVDIAFHFFPLTGIWLSLL